MKINFEKFAVNSINNYDFEALEIDQNKALKSLSKDIENEFISLNRNGLLEKRHGFFDIENSQPINYKEHYISIDENINLICGIRHFNLDKKKAFISIKSDCYLNRQALNEIYFSKLNSLFEVFNPKYIQYFSKNKNEKDRIAQCTMAQMAEVMKSNTLASDYKFKFESPNDENYYNAYQAEYEKFHLEKPKLVNAVPVNDLETMEISRKDDLLKLVYLNSKHIGWIAAEKLEFLGMPGLYFNEILLKQNMRGEGLAKYIQRQFVDEFVNDKLMVCGTIDFQNKASLRTAIQNKRKAVRYEHFMKLSFDFAQDNK